MANYLDLNPSTTAQIVAAAGANAQMQAWSMSVIDGALGRSMFGRVLDSGVGAKRPIKQILDFRSLRGQTVNFKSEAPLGASPGVQGSAANRVSQGENQKFAMWTTTIGVHWQGFKFNNIALAQTVLGIGADIDKKNRAKLSELFKLLQSRQVEATMLANKATRTTIYAGNKTSIEGLRSADTFTPNMVQEINDRMANNMAIPIDLVQPKNGYEPIRGYYITAPSPMYRDMEQSSDYQNLLALGRQRGDVNELWYGGIPMISGSILDRYQIQSDDSDGPKGTLGAPHAYLGGALGALPVTGAYMLGGGSAAAAAITDPVPPLFFQMFPGAEFKQFEQTKIAATTDVEYYCLVKNASNGKFGMYAYQVNDGNKITLTKALRSTDSTSGKIDKTTVGNVTWGTAPWTTDYLTDTNAIGDLVVPCNSYGQPYCAGYALGDNAIFSAYGMFDDGSAMGRRTFIDGAVVNHNRASEIGMDMNWNCEAVKNANGLANGFCVIYGAFNIPGMPVIS